MKSLSLSRRQVSFAVTLLACIVLIGLTPSQANAACTGFPTGVAADDYVLGFSSATDAVLTNKANAGTDGVAGMLVYDAGTLKVCDGSTWVPVGTGGSGTPGGADTQVQFNDGGAFAGDAEFVWNETTNTLDVTGTAAANIVVVKTTAGMTAPASAAAPDLDSLLDVAVTSPGNGQLLAYNGTTSQWENQTISGAGISADSLDFSEFKDALALDASTSITADGAEVLSVTNTGTGASLLVNDEASDGTPFVIDASGNVGIGKTIPSYVLDVQLGASRYISLSDNDSSGTILIGDATGTASVMIPTIYAKPVGASRYSLFLSEIDSADDTGAVPALILNARQGTSAALTTRPVMSVRNYTTDYLTVLANGNVGIGATGPAQKLDVNGNIRANASLLLNNTGSLPNGMAVDFQSAGTSIGNVSGYTSDGSSGLITFSTTNAGVPGERMRIDSTGNVGIGANTPDMRLHVYGTAGAANLGARLENAATNGYSSLLLGSAGAQGGVWKNGSAQSAYAGANSLNLGSSLAYNIGLVTSNAVRLLVSDTGNVGISQFTPSYKLDVGGDVRASGKVRADTKVVTGRLGTAGIYNSAQVQGIWSIGDGYEVDTVANDFGNHYGMAYAYNQVGGAPLAGVHQVLFTNNGVPNAAIGLSGPSYFAGNVGIGTGAQTPAARLQVAGGNILLDNATTIQAKDTAGTARVVLYPRWTDNATYLDGGTGGLYLRVNNSSTSGLYVNASGYVYVYNRLGVGVASPSQSFETNGNISMTDGGYIYGSDSSAANFIIMQAALNLYDGAGIRLYGRTAASAAGEVRLVGSTFTDNSTGIAIRFYNYANSTTQNQLGYFRSDGTFVVIGSAATCTIGAATTVSCSSDSRLKTDIQPLSSALDSIVRLQGVSYRMKDPQTGGRKFIGLVAQDVEPVFPEMVSTDDNGFKQLDYGAFVSPLIEAVKELKAKNDALSSTNDALATELADLKQQSEQTTEALREMRERLDALSEAR